MEIQAFDSLGLGQGIADHALLQAMPVAVYTTDEAGRITFYNDAAARLWGRRPVLGEDRWCARGVEDRPQRKLVGDADDHGPAPEGERQRRL